MELTYRRGTCGTRKILSEKEREMEARLYLAESPASPS